MVLKVIDVNTKFSKLYPEVASQFPDLSSDELWALSLYVLPSSPYANLPYRDKQPAISNIIRSELDWEKIDGLVKRFSNVTLPKPYRFLLEWERILEERFEFLAGIKYSEASIDLIELKDKMLASTKKLWDEYEKCRKSVEMEESTSTEGGYQESLSESGII